MYKVLHTFIAPHIFQAGLISCAPARELSLLQNFNMSTLRFALCFLALALALACGFCNASSDAGLQDNQTVDNTYQVVISLTDALPLITGKAGVT